MYIIIYHRYSGDPITKARGYFTTQYGITIIKITVRGQDLYIHFKNGYGKWVSLKYMKEISPLEVANYTKMAGVNDKPEFAWWIKRILRSMKYIIFKFKFKYWEQLHKYSTCTLKNTKYSNELDENNGGNQWIYAVKLDKRNNGMYFE